jgi:hypothetical protein
VSKGLTNRTRLRLVVSGDTPEGRRLGDLARAVNDLPFGFTGFSFTRTANYTATATNAWQGVALAAEVDSDRFLTLDGLSAKVPEGCEGVYVLSYAARASSGGTGEFRLLVDGAVIGLTTLNSTQQFTFVSPPIELRAGAEITWEYRTTNTAAQFQGRNAITDQTKVPHVSAHRVGLLA